MLNIIPLSHFVKVTSTGVSPTFTFNRLNALVISTPQIPQQAFNEYLSSNAVGTAYGLNSKEYAYAQDFFSYVSKSATTPERITFYSYYPNGSKATMKGSSLAPLNEIKKEGGFTLDIDGVATNIEVNLTSATSYTEVANLIDTALADKGACYYSNVINGLIVEVEDIGKEHTISYARAISEDVTDLSNLLGLTSSTGATIINGKDETSLIEALNEIGINNGNYVSISTLEELNPAVDFEIISEWTNASAGRYCFIANDSSQLLTTAEEQYKELKGNDGFILNYGADKKINALTQSIIASVDYSAVNGAINVNFIEADNLLDIAIDNAETLENLNKQKCNFAYNVGGYGQSQVLYGEGAIFGSIFSDISGFIGNTWLKAQLEIYGMNAFISLPLISLRGAGRNILLSALQEPINMAKRGGIITSVGQGNLTITEKNVIITATGSADTPNLIEQNGYYLMAQPLTDDDIAKKQVRLLLIYTRNTPINRVVIQNYVLGA